MNDIDPNFFFGPFTFNNLILWILGLAGLIAIADSAGFLPPWAAKWLARNRLDTTLNAMKQLGVRVETNEPKTKVGPITRIFQHLGLSEPSYKAQTRAMLEEDSFHGPVLIGGTRHFSSDKFIDVIGATTSSSRAIAYAKILNTYVQTLSLQFDYVATPKLGSPILGYEFSKLPGVAFILGTEEKVEDTSGAMGFHNRLDFPKGLELRNKRILIVDDSTTGGRKMVNLVTVLRETGAEVHDALVLFEPKGKGARDKLSKLNVQLHAVEDGPTGRM